MTTLTCGPRYSVFLPGDSTGLLCGAARRRNDIELVERTKNGRDINRHGYDLDEIEQEMQRPVVQRLLRLMTFRSYYPAFNGDFKIETTPENQVGLTWRKGKFRTTLHVDLETYASHITYYDPTVDASKPSARAILLVRAGLICSGCDSLFSFCRGLRRPDARYPSGCFGKLPPSVGRRHAKAS